MCKCRECKASPYRCKTCAQSSICRYPEFDLCRWEALVKSLGGKKI